MGPIRIGIGGWDYAPWRGLFYPDGLRKADELAFASQHLTALEINATFYRTQTPQSFRHWHDATPPGFVFSVKAARGAAQRKDAEEARPSIARFLESGLTELGGKLGAILWQFPGGRRFDADILARFLDLLPAAQDGLPLRHAVEAQHPSFDDPAALALFAERGVARVILDKDGASDWRGTTAPLVYLRLQRTLDAEPAGYPPPALDDWAERLHAYARPKGRNVMAFVIAGAKHRNPAAAQALIERVTP